MKKQQLKSAVSALVLSALVLLGALGATAASAGTAQADPTCVVTSTTSCPADGGTANG
ncbi:hypothetical protein OG455_02290 [Kitasatospora sp. NBC_01287]|uniref:hypothetical protein n=1 Tax=Kitasatospora sp. NBC_01287 TaxID=2903573 RepID=UPI0022573CE2|nr:hypothetical protein [Kitasatospora sp. NBC_01287]MCX4744354.1 hypothetical protein [Kitasatospora sp. NBC_01287]